MDRGLLEPFSKRVVAAIRRADPRTLLSYAPRLTFDFGADTSHGDTGPRAGFAFNMYCLAGSGLPVPPGVPTVPCDAGYDLTLDNAEWQSRQTGDALLLTEFGATDDLATIERIAELADQRMISWQQWHYCPCDDPTTAASPIDTQAIVLDPSRPAEGRNVKRGKLLVSVRPYPQVVAGTPLSFDFDRPQRRFDLRYSTAPAGGGGRFPPASVTSTIAPSRTGRSLRRAPASGSATAPRAAAPAPRPPPPAAGEPAPASRGHAG